MTRSPKLIGSVYIVDAQNSTRESLASAFRAAGFAVETFSNGRAFADEIAERRSDPRGRCVLLELAVDDMDGLQVQQEIVAFLQPPPVIFLTSNGNISHAVRAMKNGAFDFFERTVPQEQLLTRIRAALSKDRALQRQRSKLRYLFLRYNRLSPREKEVLDLIINGHTSRQIAARFGISVRTVENHRLQITQKMRAENTIDLARMVMSLTAGQLLRGSMSDLPVPKRQEAEIAADVSSTLSGMAD